MGDSVYDSLRLASAPRRATKIDTGAVAKLFADSFAADPVIEWLVRRDAKRDAARLSLFEFLIATFGLPDNEVWTADDHSVAALWVPPDRTDLKQPWWREILTLGKIVQVAGVSGIGRMDAFRKAMEANHPKAAPHWYLMTIGVHPARQGRGLGSALLQATLAKIDAAGMPAYLESSNAKNVPLYERHGFVVTKEFRPAPDAPPLWGMWRAAR